MEGTKCSNCEYNYAKKNSDLCAICELEIFGNEL